MSNYKLEHKYVWKELTQDGLLKSPEDCGAYYEKENVNGWGSGFDTEEEAYEAFIAFNTKHEYSRPSSLVLIKETSIYDADWRKK
jgi:hypothetical protein